MNTSRIFNIPKWAILALILSCIIPFDSESFGQQDSGSNRPFIGFRPFDGTRSNDQSTREAMPQVQFDRTRWDAPTTQRESNSPTRTPYPYPAATKVGYSPNTDANSAPERASINNTLSGARIPTGALNRGAGQATMPVTGANMNRQYQQELQQRQSQLQYQQYQTWLQQQRLAQQQLVQRQRLTQQAATARRQPTLATRPAQSAAPVRPRSPGTDLLTKPRLNQAVVQQVSSTSARNRDSQVARANYDAQKSPSDRVQAARPTATATNTVAKPQCCCVPNNCCPPGIAAQNFRPQAANQVPMLNPGGVSPTGNYGFLGQNGAGYQAQAQTGYQFQPGLGVPQFSSTGSYGNGGWFSNLVRGTGAYTPLLPIEPFYPNARQGRGIIGQPTAYVDGQPVRNLLRYLMP